MSRKRHKVDYHATEMQDYNDKRSYRTVDGKEFLFGADMSMRRGYIWANDKGKCQICGGDVMGGEGDMELDHIKSRGRGGDDSISNLRTVHISCHRKRHPQVHLRSGK